MKNEQRPKRELWNVFLEQSICFKGNRISVPYFDYFGMIAFKPWKGAIT